MLDSAGIIQLYNNVLNHDMFRYDIPDNAIVNGIQNMAEIYKPDNVALNSKQSSLADYNNAAFRCAYLHKYAAFHTAMVRDMTLEAVRMNFRFFYDVVHGSERFNLCCLGGGPGTDVIGVLCALHACFSYFQTAVTIVDYMVNWSYSFRSILQELGSGVYGAFGSNTAHYLNWRYVGADLLQPLLSPEVNNSIYTSSLVTMIKFASAAACVDTETMMKNIFSAMRPGGVLLFIDNDGGGFHELMMKVAREFDFFSVFGPIRHENYTNEAMKIKRFGFQSCFKSTVTVHFLQKPNLQIPYSSPFLDNSYISPFLASPNRRIIYNSPNMNYGSPPFFHNPPMPFVPETPLPGYLGTFDFTQDENCNFGFQYPNCEIPQSPRLAALNPCLLATPVNVINSPVPLGNINPLDCTPVSRPKRKRRKLNKGCLPLTQVRSHLSKKLDQMKFRARSLFGRRKKGQKSQPRL